LAVRLFLLVLAFFPAGLCAQEWRDDPLTDRARSASGMDAVVAYRQLLTKYPNVPTLQGEAGSAFYDEKLYDEALAAYQRAEAGGWKPERVNTRIGKCFEKLKKPAEAEAAFRKSLAVDPAAVAAQFGLGTALFNQDKASSALPIFETMTKRDDEWGAYAREYLAFCRYDTKDYEGTLALTRELLVTAPDDGALRWLNAQALYKSRRFAEALTAFQVISAADSKRELAANYYAAVCLENLGRIGEAEKQYDRVANDPTEWGKEARAAAGRIAGKPWRFVLDYVGGYDSNVLQGGVNEQGSGQKDAFNQVYAAVDGRLWRGDKASFWIGGEHFSLLYPQLHENDYIQNSVRANLNLPGAGPVTRFSLDYQLRYAELDYQAYRREHRASFTVARENKDYKLRVAFGGADNRYFGDSTNLSGPDATFAVDFVKPLPLWDHQVRVRSFNEYRWTDDPTLERLMQRLRVQYRAQIAGIVYGQIEGTVRRDDFPNSDGTGLKRRADLRKTGEIQFDAQVKKNLSINWGYLYESQSSSRPSQEFKRHQVYAGFTISF